MGYEDAGKFARYSQRKPDAAPRHCNDTSTSDEGVGELDALNGSPARRSRTVRRFRGSQRRK